MNETPKTFEAHGHTWTSHTPGDPMPCEPTKEVFILTADHEPQDFTRCACGWEWGKIIEAPDCEIIGWRYATPQEPDELATLRAERELMLAACSLVHQTLRSRVRAQ